MRGAVRSRGCRKHLDCPKSVPKTLEDLGPVGSADGPPSVILATIICLCNWRIERRDLNYAFKVIWLMLGLSVMNRLLMMPWSLFVLCLNTEYMDWSFPITITCGTLPPAPPHHPHGRWHQIPVPTKLLITSPFVIKLAIFNLQLTAYNLHLTNYMLQLVAYSLQFYGLNERVIA